MLLSKLPLYFRQEGVKKPKGKTLIQFVCCSQVPDLLPLELFTGHLSWQFSKTVLKLQIAGILYPIPPSMLQLQPLIGLSYPV